jgi:hypothetical protein
VIGSDAAVLGIAAVLCIGGIAAAAWILRWEIRAQRRARRYGGFVVGGDR